MSRIAVDVDDTVARTTAKLLQLYNLDYHDNLTINDIKSWEIHQFVNPDCGERVYDYFRQESLYDHVKPVKGSLKAIKKLRKIGHEIVFVTSTPIQIAGRKCRWLWTEGFIEWNERGYYPDYIECVDKSNISADFIIDDRPKNCLEADVWQSILFSQPHNEDYKGGDTGRLVHRANGWKEVVQIVRDFT